MSQFVEEDQEVRVELQLAPLFILFMLGPRPSLLWSKPVSFLAEAVEFIPTPLLQQPLVQALSRNLE